MEPVVVVSMVDDNFLPFAAVVAQSIAASAAKPPAIAYHIFHSGTDTALAATLAAFAPRGMRIVVHPIDNPLERFGTMGTLPPSALLRLLLPELMPEHRRIIYLDIDVLVLHDIAELAAIELGGKPIAAAVDLSGIMMARTNYPFSLPNGRSMREHLELAHGLSQDSYQSYTNSGVMVMNLDALRAAKFSERAIGLLDQVGDAFPLRDQDAINALMRGDIADLPPEWNLHCPLLRIRSLKNVPAGDIAVLQRQIAAPKLIHYVGTLKPWARTRPLPFSGLWWHHAKQTPVHGRIIDAHRAILARRGRRPSPQRHVMAALAAARWAMRGGPGRIRHKVIDNWRAGGA